jgi:NAD(P)H-dependent FMN reductase
MGSFARSQFLEDDTTQPHRREAHLASPLAMYWRPNCIFCGEGEVSMVKIAIILGSTRPGRNGEAVAAWVHDIARKRKDAEFELVDIKDYDLPLLDEPVPPSMGKYSKPHTKKWAARIAPFDGFVFVTPEYNHSTSGALKNAIDFLYAEWNNKAAGFVSYGGAMGVRAVEHLRLIMAELMIADVRAQVMLSLSTDFENHSVFKPAERKEKDVTVMLNQVIEWAEAMKTVRTRHAKVA